MKCKCPGFYGGLWFSPSFCDLKGAEHMRNKQGMLNERVLLPEGGGFSSYI